MIIVVDASVAAKWFIAEDNTDDALLLLDMPFDLHAPDLLYLEFDNILCKLIRRGLLSEEEGFDMRDRIQAFPIQPYSSKSFREKAFQIAIETRRCVYDCFYLALAEALEGCMVTADRKFFLALQGTTLEDYILWIEDLAKKTLM
jgi:predicted nucleic acid-binding protein